MAAEQKTGVIHSFFDSETGSIQETDGPIRDFYHPGAQTVFNVGEEVTYLLITFPNGKPPVVIDIKKPSRL
ncbi:MAG: hypothetical protein K0R26_2577 [Bacteroidota bacterium]|jgi:hypothetical protein|nr:hypothetical protein [Bacteroidota bacterium]